MSRQLLSLVLVSVFATTAFASGGGTTSGTSCGCIGLAVSKETAPPGSLSQMKVSLTEPKPISTGSGNLTFSAYDTLVGIALASHSKDAAGVAVVRGGAMTLSVISPAATLGDTIDYPILTVVGRVPSTASTGTKFPLSIDPKALQFYDPNGNLYPNEVKNGQLVAGNTISIGNVTPGSANLPAGATVTISGVNFQPGATVKFAEAGIASTRVVSSTQIVVTLSTPAVMHGMMIKVSNPDNSSDVYYSYQRTAPMSPSADPVLALAMPLLPPNEVTAATVPIPAPVPSTTYGIALQNIEATDAVATVDLLDATGNVAATTQLTVGASMFTVRELSELFGAAPSSAATVRVTSPAPIEVLGMIANQASGTAAPIVAQ